MNIKTIEITNLLGNKSFKIDFNIKERLRILHGPNGCGKTTILKIINYLFNYNFFGLSLIEFESIKIIFDDNQFLDVRQNTSDSLTIKDQTEFPKPSSNKNSFWDDLIAPTKIVISTANDSINYDNSEDTCTLIDLIFERQNPVNNRGEDARRTLYQALKGGENFRGREFISKHNHLPFVRNFIKNVKFTGPKLDLLDNTKVDFIGTQRLISEDYVNEDSTGEENSSFYPSANRQIRPPYRPRFITTTNSSMTVYARKLKILINNHMKTYADEAQKVDKQFMEYYFQNRRNQKAHGYASKLNLKTEENQIISKLKKTYHFQKKLAQLGIMKLNFPEIDKIFFDDLSEADFAVLSIYVNGMATKLENFRNLYKKSKRFLSAINTLFKDKIVTLSVDTGILVKLKNKATSNIPLNSLSSGEQHLLVLFYELTFSFENKEPQLLIIDEPEISLHVTWQRIFLDLLLENSEKNLYFLVSTHSPQIVGKRSKFLIALGNQDEDEGEGEDEGEYEEDSE